MNRITGAMRDSPNNPVVRPWHTSMEGIPGARPRLCGPGGGQGQTRKGVRSRNQLCLLLPKFPGSWLKETSGRGVDPPEVKGSNLKVAQSPQVA